MGWVDGRRQPVTLIKFTMSLRPFRYSPGLCFQLCRILIRHQGPGGRESRQKLPLTINRPSQVVHHSSTRSFTCKRRKLIPKSHHSPPREVNKPSTKHKKNPVNHDFTLLTTAAKDCVFTYYNAIVGGDGTGSRISAIDPQPQQQQCPDIYEQTTACSVLRRTLPSSS